MLSSQLLLATAVSQRPCLILGHLSVTILAVLVLAGRSYLAILLIAGILILAVLDAVLIAVSSASTRAISILCCPGKTG